MATSTAKATTRTFRTVDERKAEINKKIQFHKEAVFKLQTKLDQLDHPKKRRSERLKLLDEKIKSGALTKEEATTLGWKE